MVNNNKILTVSYGTFSCTLEGFDDSFGTMKAIAEYFRDLASDDRYFGAEPPQPDADMLARIAQREVTRRVEAHSENGGIVLRAHDQVAAPTAIPPSVAPAVADVVAAEEVVQSPEPAPTEAAENVAEQELAEQELVVEVAENNVNNSLEHETVAVEEPTVQVEAEFVADVEVQEEVDLASARESDSVLADDIDTTADTIAEQENHDEAEAERDVATAYLAEQVDAVAPEADSDSIAAKLERIRAVVSRSDDIVEDNGYLEDEHAVDLVAKNEDGIESVFSEEMIEQTESEEQFDSAEDEVPGNDQDDTEQTRQNLFAEDTAVEADQDEPNATEDNLDEGNVSTMGARLIKVNRLELEAAIADGDLEEIEDDTPANDDVIHELSTSLSEEDEAELQRELAEVEINLDGEAGLGGSADQDQGEKDNRHGAKLLTETGNADDDLSRLMAEAESQMDEPESTERRDAFSHLRAAVAATKAEETLRTTDDDGDSAEAYRDDLATVVKPRRPEPTGERTQRPAEARPAPLKLVAEQRIDTDGNEARGPVRPRRVASNILENGSATIEEDSGGFVEFASDMGATQLPDLLEAAASYMAFVEGREQFSRPQLMHKVRQVELQNFSREDGLRSFGKLLRAGKIEKIRGGRFTVSGEIGFKPDPDKSRATG